MANLKDLIVNGAARIIGKTYSSEFVGNVTGNVTGNLTGNAATASKLGTTTVGGDTKPIYLKDGVATAVSNPVIPLVSNGDMSGADVSTVQGAGVLLKDETTGTVWNIHTHANNLRMYDGSTEKILSENGHTHSYAGSSSVGGPATDFVAEAADNSDNKERYVYFAYDNSTYNNSNPAQITKGRAVVDSAFTYNSNTDTLTAGTFKGSLSGNATTATTADKTAYGISVGDGVSSTVAISSWKGNEAKTLAIKGTSPITTAATANTITITHNTGGANTSKGDTDNQAPGFGGTFKVTSATVDVYGHTTTLAEHTVTIPSTEASTSASGIVTTGAQAFAGAKTFADTTDSTNNTSGAVIVSGGLGVAGNIYAGAVYGAVWNDLSDSIPVDDDCDLEHGYCYCFDGEKYSKSSKYLDDGIIGIHSDTYGFKMGAEEGKKKMDVAVSGFVLAYVDKEYKPGTPLTCTKNGYLTKIKLRDKIRYPEKIIATYWKSEPADELGSGSRKVKVNGRKWVKVK